MVDDKNRIPAEAHIAAKTEQLGKECLIPRGKFPRCIDDRPSMGIEDGELGILSDEDFNGPQFLGGSLGVFALVAESMPEDQPLEFEAIFSETQRLHKEAGLEMAVHLDNHHDHLTESEVKENVRKTKTAKLGDASVVPGCGFAGLLSREDNPLGLSPRVHAFFRANPNVVDMLIQRGAKATVLKDNHAPIENAHAVENMNPDVTLDTNKAKQIGVMSYGHDTGVLGQVFDGIPEQKDRLMSINDRWLKATTNILAGMDPQKLAA